MTEEGWKVITEIIDIMKEKFDDQEKRIKELEQTIQFLKQAFK